MPASDLDLLRASIEAGDVDAFAKLVARHDDWVVRAARRRLKDDHLADDAQQSVFLLLAEKAPTLVASDAASVSAWLFYVMHYTALIRPGAGRMKIPIALRVFSKSAQRGVF